MTGPEPAWTVAIFEGTTDDRALGSGVLIDRSRVLTSLSVASGAAGLWVTFPQAGAVVRHPVTRVRTVGGLAVLSLAAPAPRTARSARVRFAGSLLGERWSAGFAYGVVEADVGGGRVRLSVSSEERPVVGAGVWAPRWEAVVAVVGSGSVAWTLSGVRSLLDAEVLSPARASSPGRTGSAGGGPSDGGAAAPGGSPRGSRGMPGADDVPERSPMIRRNGDAGPAGRSWSPETNAEPGRLWRPGADGGLVEGSPVEGSPWLPSRRPPGRDTARRRKSARTRTGRRADPAYRTAWIAGARRPERVPSAGGAVTLLCRVTIGDRILVASAAVDGTVALADPATGQARHTLRTEPGQVRALVPLRLPDASCLGIVTADGSLTAWAPEQGWGQTFTVHGGRATTATRAEAGMLAVGGEDGTVEVRALGENRPRWTATAGGGPVAALCALPGLVATAGADGQIRLRDTESGALHRTLEPSHGRLHAICPVPVGDRTLLGSAGEDGLVLLWDPDTGERRHELAGHSGPVTAVCPVPSGDGKAAVLASTGVDRTARLWDPRTGECRMTVPLHHEATACVAAGAQLIVGLAAGTVAYGLDL
jgi:WD40 repeat protein